MFKSSHRPVTVPQSEHLKLAGTITFLWGNDRFDFPPLPRSSVVAGSGLHDRGYGYLDNVAIGETGDERWIPIARRSFSMSCDDPVADVITRHHVLRLVTGRATPERQAVAQEMRLALDEQMAQHGLDPDLFQQVDRMTNLCDRISFDFCFEKSTEGQMEVFARYSPAEREVVHYKINADDIQLDPWPLRVPEHHGYLVGYQLQGYPERLDAVILPYHLRPAAP